MWALTLRATAAGAKGARIWPAAPRGPQIVSGCASDRFRQREEPLICDSLRSWQITCTARQQSAAHSAHTIFSRRQVQAHRQGVLGRFLDRLADRRMGENRSPPRPCTLAFWCNSAPAAAMHSVTLWPIMCTPSNSPVSRWRTTLTRPSVSLAAMALPRKRQRERADGDRDAPGPRLPRRSGRRAATSGNV